ncbi:hypothetical protein Droror1_Dr00010671 [Drosera rotundifolia]
MPPFALTIPQTLPSSHQNSSTQNTIHSSNPSIKMGNCSSNSSISTPTAKLILQDGTLQEFPHPIKVSYILQTNPNSIICNADDMEFGDVITALRDTEALEIGQLYFALPNNKLRRPLQPDEMAALAVKASAALMKSSGGGGGGGGSERCFSNEEVKSGGGGRRRRRRCSSGLGTIQE